MKSTVTTTFLLVVIIGAGVWVTYFYASEPAPGETIPHRMPVACEACGKAYEDIVGRQPTKCRLCGERKAWRALMCYEKDCGVIFPMVRSEGKTTREQLGVCTKCGSSMTGEVPGDAVKKP